MAEIPLHTVLRNARIAVGRPQAEVAADLGLTQTALSYWENGRRSPSLTDAERWAAAVGYRIRVTSGWRACACGDEKQYWRGWDDCATAAVRAMTGPRAAGAGDPSTTATVLP